MAQAIEAFPLHWPLTRPRTRFRESSRFAAKSFAVVRDELLREIERLGASHVVLSTNIPLRRDGLPYANVGSIRDPGVAVYFNKQGKPMVFACDRWDKIEHNIWAIHKTIEALRGIERWGAKEMMEMAFTGFQALPEADSCWKVLGVDPNASLEQISDAWKTKAKIHHPDYPGGSHERMSRLNNAYYEARQLAMKRGTP